ncbi:hypothetical protein AMTRI_Chr09g20270 [Amborella trichopoda]
MKTPNPRAHFLNLLPLLVCMFRAIAQLGSWELLQENAGISAMHMALLSNGKVVMFDRTDFGKSNLSLPAGRCRSDPNELALTLDCTAHSAEYDPVANSVRPLFVQTDVWCSSGAIAPDGRLIQTGGFNDGDHVVRVFQPCDNCDWEEFPSGLAARRWYASNQILPDGRIIVIGGRRQYNYEFYPKSEMTAATFLFRFLAETKDANENNLYPFVHLSTDGNLFVFANNRSVLLDYGGNRIVKVFPTMPGGDPRNYPSSGSSTLLPLRISPELSAIPVEVLVCGGAPTGSYDQAREGQFVQALDTCGRIRITDPSPQWQIETMPVARVMGDMVLLPTGDVLIINGASAGTAGWEFGRNPVLSPVLYNPVAPSSARFRTLASTQVPRVYHSTAILLPDGRILVGGSNPHVYYNFSGVLFPTELRLESFSPPYLSPQFSRLRPNIIFPASNPATIRFGQQFQVRFSVESMVGAEGITVTMVAPSFTTHSFSMNQRLLVLQNTMLTVLSPNVYQANTVAPQSPLLAPPGYYLIFVVHQGVPSSAIWSRISA